MKRLFNLCICLESWAKTNLTLAPPFAFGFTPDYLQRRSSIQLKKKKKPFFSDYLDVLTEFHDGNIVHKF